MKLTTTILTLVLTGISVIAAPEPPAGLDPSNAMWHFGLEGMYGTGKTRGNRGRRLDIYADFQDGQFARALATARSFNTSIHFPENKNLVFDPKTGIVKGTITILMTPDLWMPADGKAFTLIVDIDGKLTDGALSGTYKVKREDGEKLGSHDSTEFEGTLIGKTEPSQTGWDDSVWRMGMTQAIDPEKIDHDAIWLSLGVADGKVHWGQIGVSAQAKWPATKMYPIDVSSFPAVESSGLVKGSFEVTGRHIHPGGDPEEKYTAEVQFTRIQGLGGGRLSIKPKGKTGFARSAFGRGGVNKGGGAKEPKALWVHDLETRSWWKPVAGHKLPEPGEHPRLLFRKSDVAEIRKRAETADGKAIIARLRALLGNNGDSLPTEFNPTPPHNHNKSPKMPLGTFTTWHAAGYGLLYQVTGDKKYAEMSKQCVEWMLEGKNDIDNRYGWSKPGTTMRCGSVLGAMAYAYDLCYDAWPKGFRKKIALEMQNFDKLTASAEEGAAKKKREPKTVSIKTLCGRTGYPPGSNHYGSDLGGTCAALLAVLGDPGTDEEFIRARVAEIESNIPRMLSLGFGDAGWFAEGFGSSSSLSRPPTIEAMTALRNVLGKDYSGPIQNAQQMMMTFVMHVGGTGKRHMPNRGAYQGDNVIGRPGEMPMGMSILDDKQKRALLWTYETFEEKAPHAKFDSGPYPHHALYALAYWPLGEKPLNPAEVLDKVSVDTIHGYFVARNRWQDADDIIVTHWLGYGPPGYYTSSNFKGRFQKFGQVKVWGYGLRTGFTTAQAGHVTHYEKQKDGSFTMTAGGTGFAVDFSGKSDAEAVILAIGPKAARASKGKLSPGKSTSNDKASTKNTILKMGDNLVNVFTLQTGDAPEVKVKGDEVIVGKQVYSFGGKILTIGG